MVSGSADKTVTLWDLRKLHWLKKMPLEAPINCVSLDRTGKYLAVGCTHARVAYVRKWRPLATLSESADAVQGVCLSHDAQVGG